MMPGLFWSVFIYPTQPPTMFGAAWGGQMMIIPPPTPAALPGGTPVRPISGATPLLWSAEQGKPYHPWIVRMPASARRVCRRLLSCGMGLAMTMRIWSASQSAAARNPNRPRKRHQSRGCLLGLGLFGNERMTMTRGRPRPPRIVEGRSRKSINV